MKIEDVADASEYIKAPSIYAFETTLFSTAEVAGPARIQADIAKAEAESASIDEAGPDIAAELADTNGRHEINTPASSGAETIIAANGRDAAISARSIGTIGTQGVFGPVDNQQSGNQELPMDLQQPGIPVSAAAAANNTLPVDKAPVQPFPEEDDFVCYGLVEDPESVHDDQVDEQATSTDIPQPPDTYQDSMTTGQIEKNPAIPVRPVAAAAVDITEVLDEGMHAHAQESPAGTRLELDATLRDLRERIASGDVTTFKPGDPGRNRWDAQNAGDQLLIISAEALGLSGAEHLFTSAAGFLDSILQREGLPMVGSTGEVITFRTGIDPITGTAGSMANRATLQVDVTATAFDAGKQAPPHGEFLLPDIWPNIGLVDIAAALHQPLRGNDGHTTATTSIWNLESTYGFRIAYDPEINANIVRLNGIRHRILDENLLPSWPDEVDTLIWAHFHGSRVSPHITSPVLHRTLQDVNFNRLNMAALESFAANFNHMRIERLDSNTANGVRAQQPAPRLKSLARGIGNILGRGR